MKLSVGRATHCQVDHFSWASLHFSLGIQPKVRWQEMRQPRVIAPSLLASMPGTSDVCVLCDPRQSESFNELQLHNFPGRPEGRRGWLPVFLVLGGGAFACLAAALNPGHRSASGLFIQLLAKPFGVQCCVLPRPD